MNEKDEKEVQVKIYSLATSMAESIIFLDEVGGSRIIPIWIGPLEAQSIAIMLSGYPSPRPMTHDLIHSMLQVLGYKITMVKISNILQNTYYAKIYLEDLSGSKAKEIDARPSDAISLAVRYGCPIFINETVLDSIQSLNKPITQGDVEKFKEELKNMTPKDIVNQFINKKKRQGGRNSEKDPDDEQT